MTKAKIKPKIIGAGPEWCKELEEEIKEHIDEIKCIELIAENFFTNPYRKDFLKFLKHKGTPVLVHSVSLSLATDEPLKEKHLDEILKVSDQVNTVNISDHLCMTEAGGIDIGQLTPVPFSNEIVEIVSKKIEKIQKITKIPFALENIAQRFFYPNNELSETDFINKILDNTGCEFLLDLHNLYCNAKNNNFDAYIWLEKIHLNKVSSIHLAGGYQSNYGAYLDGHSDPVPNKVWDLLKYTLKNVIPQTIIVERTSNYPGIKEILLEVNKAQQILEGAYEFA